MAGQGLVITCPYLGHKSGFLADRAGETSSCALPMRLSHGQRSRGERPLLLQVPYSAPKAGLPSARTPGMSSATGDPGTGLKGFSGTVLGGEFCK